VIRDFGVAVGEGVADVVGVGESIVACCEM